MVARVHVSITLVVVMSVGSALAAGSAVGGAEVQDEILTVFGLAEDFSASNVYEVDLESGASVKITDFGRNEVQQPALAPDGGSYVYIEVATSQVVVFDALEGSRVTLPDAAPTGARGPSWSPDGTRIAYSRGRLDAPGSEPYVIGADGSGLMSLSEGQLSAAPTPPAWSPDGLTVVFRGEDADGARGLWSMSSFGGELTQITTSAPGFVDTAPVYGPQGKYLYYVASSRVDEDSRLMRVDVSGERAEPELVTYGDFNWIAISPDGTQLAADSSMGGNGVNQCNASVCVLDIANRTSRQLNIDGVVSISHLQWQQRCTIVGTAGDDYLVGTPGDDRICGFGGNDVIRAQRGADVVFGGDGDDRVLGNIGADQLYGGLGDDLVVGGAGPDEIVGGPGTDLLRGGSSPDWILSVDFIDGNDRVIGGKRDDVCILDVGDIESLC